MSEKPYVIVLGNEKGGTGKSTVSMHLLIQLLRLGFKVGSIDVDARQGTLTRYLNNRRSYMEKAGISLPVPDHQPLQNSALGTIAEARQDEAARLDQAMQAMSDKDFILVDTPGSDSNLSRLAHAFADTLITPLNDSFIDLDVLAHVDPDKKDVVRPSTYAEMVWEQKKQRLLKEKGKASDWIVLRNRLSSLYTRNKEDMLGVLEKLGQRIGFRLAPGFGERIIFRELFLKGLTLLDLQDAGIELTLSHVAARQELRALLQMIKLPQLEERLGKTG